MGTFDSFRFIYFFFSWDEESAHMFQKRERACVSIHSIENIVLNLVEDFSSLN